jgi:spore germination protein GerM
VTTLRSHFTAVLMIVLVLGACAVPTDERADSVAISPEFSELLEPAPTTLATTTTTPERQRLVGLYFIVDDLLARQDTLIAISRAESLTAVLNELVVGTRQENHRSAIPSGVAVSATSIDSERGVATIVLADNTLFTAVEGTERRRAISQFVFTATSNRFGVDAVQFEIDGNIRSVPTGGGSDKTEPVGKCDYELFWDGPSLGCPGATTTTSPPPAQNGDQLSQIP